jgi:hypothetical protein
VPGAYRVYVWDNGGAVDSAAALRLPCYAIHDPRGRVINIGKAAAVRHLVDIARDELPGADCYVCMDDDVVADRPHLDALVAAARTPGLGMIGAAFHPFNSPEPSGGEVRSVSTPGGDLRLRVYPPADRTERNVGRVAGTLFAVSAAAVAALPWAPAIYPVLADHGSGRPVVYWSEDGTLDIALTRAGLVNGYLADPTLTPAIHLPELNDEYLRWKVGHRRADPSGPTVNPF